MPFFPSLIRRGGCEAAGVVQSSPIAVENSDHPARWRGHPSSCEEGKTSPDHPATLLRGATPSTRG